MNDKLLESVHDLNNIIVECNTSFIYESIMLDCVQINSNQEVVYEETSNEHDSKKKNEESIQKKKSFLEKVKSAWRAFVDMMKRMMKACIDFIRKNVKMIKSTFEVNVYVADRSYLINALKDLNNDVKSGKAVDNIIKSHKLGADDYYIAKYHDMVNDEPTILKMKKGNAIKFLEKQLNEANTLISAFDKEVDRLLKLHEETSKYNDRLTNALYKYNVELVNNARIYYKDLISLIVEDIQKLTNVQNDMEEKGGK